jgi:hypothetical protein
MRRIFLLAVLAAGAAVNTGCGLCCGGAKPGFSIAYNLPPTISQSTIAGPQVTSFAPQGLACGPTAGQLGLYSADVSPLALRTVERAPVVERLPLRSTDCASPGAAAADVYTPQEIYRLVERLSRQVEAMHALQRQLQQQRAPKPAPMPMPKECDGDASDD